ncbi:MAG TPA: ABC transporter ATP-binding protein [Nitrososphaerales archaeon]|nr:ABC transporter ATP-binding protein [Nitrososphaerales archaeon]
MKEQQQREEEEEEEIQKNVLVELKDVTKRFGGLAAVNAVSFSIARGERVGLIGPNGAGKTTLFNLITGFARPDSGAIFFEGRNITKMSTSDVVNLGIARTFQIVRPFTRISVYENVLIPSLSPNARRASGGKAPDEIAMGALRLTDLIDKMKFKASELTHGELKRLELARAIATKPRLLLLDEPFGGLGSNEIGPATDLIQSLPSLGITLLMIEHRMKELMKNVGRIIAMDQGSLIASGTPEQVVRNERLIEAYLGKRLDRVE